MSKRPSQNQPGQTVSTDANPYHYLGSGLPNVYLVGVKYRIESGEQSAEIPCLPELLNAIAKAVVAKKAPLTSDEVRFLRKRMGIASKDFAEMIGYSAEHYSRLENGESVRQIDLLVRLYYAAHAKLTSISQNLVTCKPVTPKWRAGFDRRQNIIASKDSKNVWHVEFDDAAA